MYKYGIVLKQGEVAGVPESLFLKWVQDNNIKQIEKQGEYTMFEYAGTLTPCIDSLCSAGLKGFIKHFWMEHDAIDNLRKHYDI